MQRDTTPWSKRDKGRATKQQNTPAPADSSTLSKAINFYRMAIDTIIKIQQSWNCIITTLNHDTLVLRQLALLLKTRASYHLSLRFKIEA